MLLLLEQSEKGGVEIRSMQQANQDWGGCKSICHVICQLLKIVYPTYLNGMYCRSREFIPPTTIALKAEPLFVFQISGVVSFFHPHAMMSNCQFRSRGMGDVSRNEEVLVHSE